MAYLATHDYLEDKNFVDKWLYTMRTGEMDLSWMNAKTEKVTPRPQNARRGLTYRDLDLGSYGFTTCRRRCATIALMRRVAPRFPRACPTRSRGSRAKASCGRFNTESYYEEAVSRQWNATTDIPWDRLEGVEMPEATGKALSQLMTFLTEVEMIATDTPGDVAAAAQPRFYRGQSLHREPGDGRGAPCRGLPQARADHRLRPDGGEPDE